MTMSALFSLFTKRETTETTAAAPVALVTSPTAREPRTLEELGVPGSLARELEATLRVLGHTRGEQITGFTFRAANGTRYALKTSATPAREVLEA